MDSEPALHNAIKVVYPETDTMLCTQHVNNYVAINYKMHFATNNKYNKFFAAQRSVYQAQTVNKFKKNQDKLCVTYSSRELYKAIKYLQDTQIKPGQKERLVAAQTSKYLHFNTFVTSRYVIYRVRYLRVLAV